MQDAILAAMENIGDLKDEAKFQSWFFTIITRTFYAAKRQETQKGKFFALLNGDDPVVLLSTRMTYSQVACFVLVADLIITQYILKTVIQKKGS